MPALGLQGYLLRRLAATFQRRHESVVSRITRFFHLSFFMKLCRSIQWAAIPPHFVSHKFGAQRLHCDSFRIFASYSNAKRCFALSIAAVLSQSIAHLSPSNWCSAYPLPLGSIPYTTIPLLILTPLVTSKPIRCISVLSMANGSVLFHCFAKTCVCFHASPLLYAVLLGDEPHFPGPSMQ